MTPATLLKKQYPHELVDALLEAYSEIESNYALRKWKASELDSGHFVEAARRILEAVLFSGVYTKIGVDLPKLTDKEMIRYENATGDEAFRILIPRALRSIYGIRSKRGIAHVGKVSPNEMDATLILYSTKWVLAELLRQATGMTPADTQKLVDTVIERRLSVLWKHGDLTRVLSKIEAREQVLVLLYDENNQSVEKLQAAIEYKNSTNFRKLLGRLHDKRMIELRADGVCMILPPGIIAAEEILRGLKDE